MFSVTKIILAISHLFSLCPFCFPGPNCWAYLSGGVSGVQMGAGISVQLPGGSNRREQFVWGLLMTDGSRWLYPVPGRVHAQGEGRISSYRLIPVDS